MASRRELRLRCTAPEIDELAALYALEPRGELALRILVAHLTASIYNAVGAFSKHPRRFTAEDFLLDYEKAQREAEELGDSDSARDYAALAKMFEEMKPGGRSG